jgi:hypothetical protein
MFWADPRKWVPIRIYVKTIRLEDFPLDNKVKLLNLEVEGFEPEVLRGLGRKIANVENVTADLGFERRVDLCTTLPEVTNSLLQNDFEVVGYFGYPWCDRHAMLYRNNKLHAASLRLSSNCSDRRF